MTNETIIDARVKILRIITLALVSGVVIFGLIAVFVMDALNPAQPAGSTMQSSIGGLFAILAFVLHLLVPNLLARQMLANRSGDLNSLLDAYQTKTIVALAILEGAAFLNIVACILEHQWWSLAVAGGLVFWMLARFPSRGMIEQWIEPQRN